MLDVAGTLTVGTGGEITNSAGDYTIDETGITMGPNLNITMGVNSVITDSAGNYTIDADGINFNPTSNYLDDTAVTWAPDWGIGGWASGGVRQTQYKADQHLFTSESGVASMYINTGFTGGQVDFNAAVILDKVIRFANYSDLTRPDNPDPGMAIYNTDANTIQVADNNGNWKGL